MTQGSKRTRSQLTLPAYDLSLDRSPLKDARTAARSAHATAAALDARALQYVDARANQMFNATNGAPVGDRARTPPPRARRDARGEEEDEETEDELLLSPARSKMPAKRASPLPDHDVDIDAPEDRGREIKRPRREDAAPPIPHAPSLAGPSRHLDLAALATTRAFPRGRSRSRSRSPKKRAASHTHAGASLSRAYSVPMTSTAGMDAVPHLDLTAVAAPSPWRSSPTKRLMRIASQPPLAVAEEHDDDDDIPAAGENMFDGRKKTRAHSRNASPAPPIPLPAPKPPSRQSSTARSRDASPAPAPALAAPETPSRHASASAPPSRHASAPRSPAAPTPTLLSEPDLPQKPSPAASTSSASRADTPPPTASEPSSPLSPLTPLPPKTPFFGRARAVPEPSSDARARDGSPGAHGWDEAPAGAFEFPGSDHEDAPMDVDTQNLSAGEPVVTANAPAAVPTHLPRPPSALLDHAPADGGATTSQPAAPPPKGKIPPLTLDIPPKKRGTIADRMKTKAGVVRPPTASPATAVPEAGSSKTGSSKAPAAPAKAAARPAKVVAARAKPASKVGKAAAQQQPRKVAAVLASNRVTRSSAGKALKPMEKGVGSGKEQEKALEQPTEKDVSGEMEVDTPKGDGLVDAPLDEPPTLPPAILDPPANAISTDPDPTPSDAVSSNTAGTSDGPAGVNKHKSFRSTFAAPTSSSLAKSKPKSRPSSPARGRASDEMGDGARARTFSAASDGDSAPERGRPLVAPSSAFKTPGPSAKPRPRASSVFASGSRQSAAAAAGSSGSGANLAPSSTPAARGTITSFFQPKSKPTPAVAPPATPAPKPDGGKPTSLATLERALERLAAPVPVKRNTRPSTSMGFNPESATSDDDDPGGKTNVRAGSVKPASSTASKDDSALPNGKPKAPSLKRTATDAALTPRKPVSGVSHKRHGSTGAPTFARASSVPVATSMQTSTSSNASSDGPRVPKRTTGLSTIPSKTNGVKAKLFGPASFGHSLAGAKRTFLARPATGVMGSRVAPRASKKTPLATVEGSPVKGWSATVLESSDSRMDTDQEGEVGTEPAGSSRPPPAPLARPTFGRLNTPLSDTEDVFTPMPAPDIKGKGKERDAWIKNASRRASLASQMLTQSLEELPQTPPAPAVGAMGPPAPPSTSGVRTRQAAAGGQSTKRWNVDGALEEPQAKKGQAKGPSLGVLEGSVIFVDVRTDDGDDAGSLFAEMLQGLGARLVTRVGPTCTHIVFKNGLMSTVTRWRILNDPKPFVVGIGWVVACAEQRVKVDEAKFKVDFEDLNVAGTTKRRRSMLPKHISSLSSDGSAAAVPSTQYFDGGFALDGTPAAMQMEEDDLPPLERARRRRSLAVPQ